MTSDGPNSTLSTIIACGIQQPHPLPSPRTSFNFSRGNQNYPNCSRISAVGRVVSLEPERCTAGVVYRIEHLLFLPGLLLPTLRRAARVAASKTSRTPSLVRAEHSRYL
jgi:hypothetical protein